MKKRGLIDWIVAGPAAVLMLVSAVPDLLRVPQAVSIITHLGYPPYLLIFLGTAKTLGAVTILLPGRARLKEWAFAGLTFDVTGALYSHLSVGDPPAGWLPAAVALLLVSSSYVMHRRQLWDDRSLLRQPREAGVATAALSFGDAVRETRVKSPDTRHVEDRAAGAAS
jgi:DoxX-like protein